MNLVIGVLLSESVARHCCNSSRIFWSFFVAHAVMTFVGYKTTFVVPFLGNFDECYFSLSCLANTALLGRLALFSGRKWRRPFAYWYAFNFTTFLVAYLFWLNGKDRSSNCNPRSLWQPHAVWHILTAVSIWGIWQSL